MFVQISDQMHNWKWDDPRAFWDEVDRSTLQTTRSGKVKRTGEGSSWYANDDLRTKNEPPSCRQYRPGDFLADKPLDWDEIIDGDYDEENWADPAVPSGERRRPGNGNDNDDGESEEDTQGTE